VHGPSVASHPHCELIGVWGRDPGRTADLARDLGVQPFADLDDLLGHTDAFTFAVPPEVQAPVAVRAAKQGRHLLLEKPIALSVDDAVGIECAVADARVASIVFFTRRFLPETRAWFQLVTQRGGWYAGRAESHASLFGDNNPFGTSPWRREHGALWDIGPHALAQLVPVLGDVTAVSAVAGRGDLVHLVLRHTENRSSTVSLSLTSPAFVGSSLYVDGTTGRSVAPMGAVSIAESIAAHQAALDALIEQSQQEHPSHACDVHFGARVVAVLAAARQSLASGCLVQVVPPAR
jgi:predicted dehydrogenase